MPCAGVSLGPGGAVQVILGVCRGLWALPAQGTLGGDGATEHHGRATVLWALWGWSASLLPHPSPVSVQAVDTGTAWGHQHVALHNRSPQLQGVCSACCSH